MKIRILNNSIRLRLSQLEIQELAHGKPIIGKVPFPDGSHWSYQLQAIEQPALFQAQLSDQSIQINISSNAGKVLQETDLVGHDGVLETPDGPLKILVEKDFKCLTPRAEEESGLFENPNLKC